MCVCDVVRFVTTLRHAHAGAHACAGVGVGCGWRGQICRACTHTHGMYALCLLKGFHSTVGPSRSLKFSPWPMLLVPDRAPPSRCTQLLLDRPSLPCATLLFSLCW